MPFISFAPVRVLRISLIICLILVGLPTLVWAGEFTAFGPKNFIRETGTPVTVIDNFSILNPNTEFILRVYNGGLQDTPSELVSSSIISINGKQVLGPEKFNQTVTFIEIPVSLQSNSTVETEIRGKPGGLLTVTIVGIDNIAPNIQIITPPNGSILANAKPAISGDFSDNLSGIDTSTVKIALDGVDVTSNATITSTGFSYTPTANLSDGTHSVTVDVKDKATNPTTQANWGFVTDITPPQLSINPVTSPTKIATQIISGSYIEERIDNIKVNGATASIDNVAKTYSAEIVLTEGANNINVIVADTVGNTASSTLTIYLDTTPPVPPVGLSATAGDTVADLSWIVNTEQDLAGYNIYRSETQGGPYTKVNSIFITQNFYHDISLTNGTAYYYVITAQDALGHNSSNSGEISVTPVSPDITPPQINNLLPADGALLANAKPTISALFSDDLSGIDTSTVRIILDGVDITSGATITATEFTYTPSTNLAEGIHSVTADVKDKAGNAAVQATTAFRVDTTPPQLNITSPLEGEVMKAK